MGLDSQTKSVNCIINFPLDCDNEQYIYILSELKKYLNAHTVEYYFIVHDMDTKIVDNKQVLKVPHIHCLFKSNDKKHRLSFYLNQLSKCLNISTLLITVDIWKDYEGAIQYLVHKNDKDKFLYDSSLIITNMSNETLSLILEREINANFDIDYLIFLIKDFNGSVSKVYKSIGIGNSKQYRNVIFDLIKEYERGNL